MNPRHIFRLSRLLPVFALALIAAPIAHAATDDAAQRQLREDRERFQREVERQRTESQIQTERARQSAEQQRTADELARLRAQQDRQSSEVRSLTETTRTLTTAPAAIPSPRVATSPTPFASPTTTVATITPDFALTLLPDGRCVLHLKDRPPEIKTPAEVQAALQQLLTRSAPSPASSAPR